MAPNRRSYMRRIVAYLKYITIFYRNVKRQELTLKELTQALVPHSRRLSVGLIISHMNSLTNKTEKSSGGKTCEFYWQSLDTSKHNPMVHSQPVRVSQSESVNRGRAEEVVI